MKTSLNLPTEGMKTLLSLHRPRKMGDASTYLYADDTAIVCSGKTFTDVSHKLEQQLFNARKWLQNHKLTLNLPKTKVMFFGTQNKLSKIETKTLDTRSGDLDIVDQFKYLGVTVNTPTTSVGESHPNSKP